MKYVIADGVNVTKSGTITELFPNVSFPSTGTPADFISDNNLLEINEWITVTEPDEKLVRDVDPYIFEGIAYNCRKETCNEEEKNSLIAAKWYEVRQIRDDKLQESDWRAIKAAETGVAMSTEWLDYRKALRDLPASTTDPYSVTYPTEPT